MPAVRQALEWSAHSRVPMSCLLGTSPRLLIGLLVIAGVVCAVSVVPARAVGASGDGGAQRVRLLKCPPPAAGTGLGVPTPEPAVDHGSADPARLTVRLLLRLFRRWVSPVYGTRCPMHPSCSAYAERAIEVAGVPLGMALAADRLLRCGHDRRMYRLVVVNGRYVRYFDPPASDD